MPVPTIGDLVTALADVDRSIPITLGMVERDWPDDVAEIVDMLTQEAE